MRKCPFCGAQIEDDAKFCLYCMTELEEKTVISKGKTNKKLWAVILAAFVFVCIISVSLFFITGKKDSKMPTASISSTQSEESTSEQENQKSESKKSEDLKTKENKKSEDTSDKPQGASSLEAVTGNAVSGSAISGGSSSSSKSSTGSSSSSKSSSTSGSSSNSNSSSAAGTSSTTLKFGYRDAIPADDYTGNASYTNNAIVITTLVATGANGECVIPETIDGKKVAAIGSYAMGSSIKTLVIPESVKTIHTYAFTNGYNLTDIYIKGEHIAAPSEFLPPLSKRNYNITIHCSKTCDDRNFRTYKTLCELYGLASYKEWNG